MPSTTPTPTPTNHENFDPWYTASTGHQRPEYTSSNGTSWRSIRAEALARQFHRDTRPRPADTTPSNTNPPVPTGEWKWVSGSEADRHRLGCQDIRSYLGVRKRGWSALEEGKEGDAKRARVGPDLENGSEDAREEGGERRPGGKLGVFAGTTIYVNGSTMPLVSDHKLKQLLVSHGAKLALSLARASVTHVVVGRPSAVVAGKGAGGGLAARKLHTEIVRSGRQVKVVYAEWVLDSIKASKRLSEANFALNIAPNGLRSVLGMFKR